MSRRQSWYQLGNESDEQFTAFITYYSTRSISETAEVMRSDPDTIRQWYEEYDWGLRIDEYAYHAASSAEALSIAEESRQWQESCHDEDPSEDGPEAKPAQPDPYGWMDIPKDLQEDDDPDDPPILIKCSDEDGGAKHVEAEDDEPYGLPFDDDEADEGGEDDEPDGAAGLSSGLTWDRMYGETDKAYAAFCIYRDMGRGFRNIRAAAEKMGRSRQLLERWSRQYDWVERAARYDDEVDRLAMTQAVDDRKAMVRKQDDLAILMIDTGIEAIKAKAPADISARDAISLMKEGAAIQRAIRDIEWRGAVDETSEQISRESYAYKTSYHAGKNLLDALM